MDLVKPSIPPANPFDTLEAALDYQHWWESPLGEMVFRVELSTLSDLMPPHPARGLDLGCGTGNFTAAIAKSGYQVIGVDSSLAMLAMAKRQMLDPEHPASWVHAEMESLPFTEGAFDFVIQIASLEFARDRKAALREVARVLRRGGCYILGLVSHQSLFGLLKPSRRREIPEIAVTALHAELGGFQLDQERQDIYFPPWNAPSIRWWGSWFERTGSFIGHGGARRLYQFRRV